MPGYHDIMTYRSPSRNSFLWSADSSHPTAANNRFQQAYVGPGSLGIDADSISLYRCKPPLPPGNAFGDNSAKYLLFDSPDAYFICKGRYKYQQKEEKPMITNNQICNGSCPHIKGISRRDFIKGAAVAGAGLLVGCGSAKPTSPPATTDNTTPPPATSADSYLSHCGRHCGGCPSFQDRTCVSCKIYTTTSSDPCTVIQTLPPKINPSPVDACQPSAPESVTTISL
jgi:hypothetical protein